MVFFMQKLLIDIWLFFSKENEQGNFIFVKSVLPDHWPKEGVECRFLVYCWKCPIIASKPEIWLTSQKNSTWRKHRMSSPRFWSKNQTKTKNSFVPYQFTSAATSSKYYVIMYGLSTGVHYGSFWRSLLAVAVTRTRSLWGSENIITGPSDHLML